MTAKCIGNERRGQDKHRSKKKNISKKAKCVCVSLCVSVCICMSGGEGRKGVKIIEGGILGWMDFSVAKSSLVRRWGLGLTRPAAWSQ